MPRIKLLVKKFSYRQLKEVCNDENWKIPTLADVREKEIDSEPFWIKDLPESQDQLTHSLAYNPKVGNIMLVNKNNLMSSVVLVEDQSVGCDGCIYEPKPGGNFRVECGECSRFYADGYEGSNE